MVPLLFLAFTAAAPTPPDPPLPAEVRALIDRLNEPSAEARSAAITELRLLARRVDASGAKRVRHGEPAEPKVKGLVPYLIRASKDEAEWNRILALHALADTLDPAATDAIRNALKDKSALVRLNAACLLTEFQDAAGLPEMKAALARIRKNQEDAGPFGAEQLLASFERITGKSFGEIPMNPILLSNTRAIAATEERYKELLDAWAEWWEWQPGKK